MFVIFYHDVTGMGSLVLSLYLWNLTYPCGAWLSPPQQTMAQKKEETTKYVPECIESLTKHIKGTGVSKALAPGHFVLDFDSKYDNKQAVSHFPDSVVCKSTFGMEN